MLLPFVHTWKEWGEMFTDLARWKPAVDEICRRESIPFRSIETGYPGTNAVFVLDQTYVLKIYAPFCHEEFDLERELYPILERNSSIPAPRLIAQGILQDRMPWPYIVIDFKPGEPIREVRGRISRANMIEIASDMGRIVRELHRTPIAQIKGLDRSPEGWMRFVRSRQESCAEQIRSKGVLPDVVIAEIADLFASARLGCGERPLVLLNGDLTEDHLLLHRSSVGYEDGGWRISGLIDFADALIGPREYEWIALWFGALDRDSACLQAFMESYDPGIELDEAFYRQAMAFTFLHEFGAEIIAWTLKRLGNPRVCSMQELQQVLWDSS
jgi:hygromycin-B 7''-O-kinase